MVGFWLQGVIAFHKIFFIRYPFFAQELVLFPPKILVDLVKGITLLGPSFSFYKQAALELILIFRIVEIHVLRILVLLLFINLLFVVHFKFLASKIIFQFWQDFELLFFSLLSGFDWRNWRYALIHVKVISHDQQVKRHLFLKLGNVLINR